MDQKITQKIQFLKFIAEQGVVSAMRIGRAIRFDIRQIKKDPCK